jgi:hypothetical protein
MHANLDCSIAGFGLLFPMDPLDCPPDHSHSDHPRPVDSLDPVEAAGSTPLDPDSEGCSGYVALLKVLIVLILKAVQKLLSKLLCLIDLVILRWKGQWVRVAIRWQVIHICMPHIEVFPVQDEAWYCPIPASSFQHLDVD